VIVSATQINVVPENRRELFQTILPLLDPIRHEKGCLACRCYIELADENSAMLISEWEAQADWENHRSSSDFAVLLGALNALATPANIDFKLLGMIAAT
jgi:quinol monooxygenase YgiN